MPISTSKANTSSSKSVGDYFRLLRDAKKSGSAGKLFAVLDVISRHEQAQTLIPSRFHAVATLYTSPVYPSTNIFGELIWGSILLQRSHREIEEYLTLKLAIEALVISSRWREALSLILQFELKHGTAAVLKELSIAITQQAEGTVKQVAYSRRLEALCINSAFPHFIRFASERNEDRLTLSGFRRSFRERYGATELSPLVIAIIHWHGLHQLPNDEELQSQLLSFEGSGSIFDYYEAYVAVATQLASRSKLNLRTALGNSLIRLSEFTDQRVVNLRLLLAEEYSSSRAPLTATGILLQIRARLGLSDDHPPTERAIFSMLEDKQPEADVRRNIHKLSANFFHLSFFQAVFSHLEHKTSPDCLDQAVAPGLAVLATQTSLRSVLACRFELALDAFNALAEPMTASIPDSLNDNSSDIQLFTALAHARNGNTDKVICLAQTSTLNAIDRSHLAIIAINACYRSERYVDLLPLALDLSDIRLDALSLVPIVKALCNIYPGRLSERDAVLFSIVASRALLIEDSERLEDKLIVATETAFAKRLATPTWAHDGELSLQLWIGFLRDVLIVQNMLLIDEVNSLRDALNLRVEVLRQLVELDPENRAKVS